MVLKPETTSEHEFDFSFQKFDFFIVFDSFIPFCIELILGRWGRIYDLKLVLNLKFSKFMYFAFWVDVTIFLDLF